MNQPVPAITEDTLRTIAEDAFLLASNILEGDDLDEGESSRDLRISELVIDLGEKICRTCGIVDPWVPENIRDFVDPR